MEHMDLYFEECKFANDSTGEFSGLAVSFGTEIPNPPIGSDTIRRGAFAKSLATKGAAGVKLLWQHDATQPVGEWLSLREEADGLKVHGRLLMDLPKAREAHTLMKNKIVDGLSIGFVVPQGGARVDERTRTRTISEADLWEVSMVTFPADVRGRVLEMKSARAGMAQVLADIRALRRLVRAGR